jgi:hypothetical protein
VGVIYAHEMTNTDKRLQSQMGMVADAYNPRHSGGSDQVDHSLRPARPKTIEKSYLNQ